MAQPLWFRSFRQSEERELAEQHLSGTDEAFCQLNSLLGFVRRGYVCGQAGIFQLIPSAPEVCERPEALAKLSPDRAFHRIMTSAGSGAHTLLRQQGDAGESCGVVRKDVSTRHMLLFPLMDELLHLSCTYLPPKPSPGRTISANSLPETPSGAWTTTEGPD